MILPDYAQIPGEKARIEINLIRERIPSIVNALNALNEHPEQQQLCKGA